MVDGTCLAQSTNVALSDQYSVRGLTTSTTRTYRRQSVPTTRLHPDRLVVDAGVVGLYGGRESQVLFRVLVAAEHERMCRELSQLPLRRHHLLRCTFEEAAAASQEQSISGEDGRFLVRLNQVAHVAAGVTRRMQTVYSEPPECEHVSVTDLPGESSDALVAAKDRESRPKLGELLVATGVVPVLAKTVLIIFLCCAPSSNHRVGGE